MQWKKQNVSGEGISVDQLIDAVKGESCDSAGSAVQGSTVQYSMQCAGQCVNFFLSHELGVEAAEAKADVGGWEGAGNGGVSSLK